MSANASWTSRARTWARKHIPLLVFVLTILSGSSAYAVAGAVGGGEISDSVKLVAATMTALASVLGLMMKHTKMVVHGEVGRLEARLLERLSGKERAGE